MRKKHLPFIGLLVMMLLLTCSTQKLDEKKDAEYSGIRIKLDSLLVSVDTLTAKMHVFRQDHDIQDEKIDKYVRSPEDKELQEKHNLWFADFEPVLDSLIKGTLEIEEVLVLHDELEAAHDTAAAKVIKADHRQMLEEIEVVETKTGKILEQLIEADSIIHTFFDDHRYLNDKYNIPREFTTLPPTFK